MEKLARPNNGSWFGEGEIVDADLLVDLLEAYRFGKANVPPGKIRFKAVVAAPPDNTTEMKDEENDNESQGNKSVHESTSSISSNSDPIIPETIMSEIDSNNEPCSSEEIGSNNEPGSNAETDYNWLESNSTNFSNVENDRQQNAEVGEIEEEREEEEEGEEEDDIDSFSSESEEKSNLEKLLAIQESYELYCPSCSSCITRKVILKKRKRGKDVDLPVDLKPIVPDLEESSDVEEIEPPVKVHVPETRIENDDKQYKGEGVIFTYSTCLRNFIRLGASFLQFDYIKGKPVEEPETQKNKNSRSITNLQIIEDQVHKNPLEEIQIEARKSNTAEESPPQKQPDRERFAVELLKSTVYGGLTETITSLGVVASASASGSSTVNIVALAIANLAGGFIVLAQNLHDLRNSSVQEKDRYEELLGRRSNFRIHIVVAVLSYILFGLIPPLVYAFSFYETGIKNHTLVSVFLVSLVCVILLGMIKVYVRKPPNVRESPKPYFKSAAYYTSIVIASSGISYVVGDRMGQYIGRLGWFSLDQVGTTNI